MTRIRTKVNTLCRRLRGGLGVPVREVGDGSGTDRSTPDADGSDGEQTAVLAPRAYGSKTELVEETDVSPREYLTAVLEAHDGRLSQREICEHTGWPSSTVSCLLGQMDDRGEVVRIRLGRKKLVFLPDDVPEIRETERDRPGRDHPGRAVVGPDGSP